MYQILQEASGHWPLVALTSLVLYFMTVATYRLTLHPLAKFPGPKLAAITKWYEAYYDLVAAPGGQFSGQIRNMHDKYGPIVRINPTEVSVRDPEFYETLYAPQPAVRDKFPPIAAVLGTTSGTFGTIDHHVHRKRRAANSNFFSSRNLALSEPLIQAHVERFCKHLRDGAEAGTVFRLRTWFMALKLDIFFEYAFADTLGLLDNTELAGYWDDTMEAISYCAPFVKMFPDLIQFSTKIPWIFVRMVSPELARVLALHKVCINTICQLVSGVVLNRYPSEFASKPANLLRIPNDSLRSRRVNQTPCSRRCMKVTCLLRIRRYGALAKRVPKCSRLLEQLHESCQLRSFISIIDRKRCNFCVKRSMLPSQILRSSLLSRFLKTFHIWYTMSQSPESACTNMHVCRRL